MKRVNFKEELGIFIRQAKPVLAAEGFDLRSWESTGNDLQNEKRLVLGISWNKVRDTLAINSDIVKIGFPGIVTKRKILSAAHKVFDPIGFSCPAN